MKTVEQYRSYARDCRRMAAAARDSEREALLQIADAWDVLAEQRETKLRKGDIEDK